MKSPFRTWVVLATAAATLTLLVAPAGAITWNTKTFDAYLTVGTNPCDGSAVPERTGTTTLYVTEFTGPSGADRVFVRVVVNVEEGEYETRLVSRASFDEASDAYTFPAKSVTYRNGVREFVSYSSQTVFMTGDQPVRHSIFGGPGSVCVRPQ